MTKLTKRRQLDQWLERTGEQVVLADGFDDALIGVVQIETRCIAVYDREQCIQILMKRDGADREDADEFFEYNCQGASVGAQTPGFLIWTPDTSPAKRKR